VAAGRRRGGCRLPVRMHNLRILVLGRRSIRGGKGLLMCHVSGRGKGRGVPRLPACGVLG
jgi:hypothetical protein